MSARGDYRRSKERRRKRTIRRAISLAILLSVILLGVSRIDLLQKLMYPLDYDNIVQKYAEEYDLDPLLVHSVIRVESGHDASAASGKGAIGLMQIMPDTGQWASEKIGMKSFTEDMLYDPEINIMIGCWYLRYLIDEFEGNKANAISAYNGGIGNVLKWLETHEYSPDGENLENIPFEETRNYVERVLGSYEKYKELYGEI